MFTIQFNQKKNKERVFDRDGFVRRVSALCTNNSSTSETEVGSQQSMLQKKNNFMFSSGSDLFMFSVIVDNKQIIA